MSESAGRVVAYIVFAKSDEYPNPVAIHEYAGSVSIIRDRVMAKAMREGFKGDFVTRMADLGWWLERLVPEQLLVEAERDVEKLMPILIEWCNKVSEHRQARERLECKVRALADEMEVNDPDREMSDGWRRASAYCARKLRRALTETPSEETR